MPLILKSHPTLFLFFSFPAPNQNFGHRPSPANTLPVRAAIDVRPYKMTYFRVLEHPPKRASISTGHVCVGSEYYPFCHSQPSQEGQKHLGGALASPHPIPSPLFFPLPHHLPTRRFFSSPSFSHLPI